MVLSSPAAKMASSNTTVLRSVLTGHITIVSGPPPDVQSGDLQQILYSGDSPESAVSDYYIREYGLPYVHSATADSHRNVIKSVKQSDASSASIDFALGPYFIHVLCFEGDKYRVVRDRNASSQPSVLRIQQDTNLQYLYTTFTYQADSAHAYQQALRALIEEYGRENILNEDIEDPPTNEAEMPQNMSSIIKCVRAATSGESEKEINPVVTVSAMDMSSLQLTLENIEREIKEQRDIAHALREASHEVREGVARLYTRISNSIPNGNAASRSSSAALREAEKGPWVYILKHQNEGHNRDDTQNKWFVGFSENKYDILTDIKGVKYPWLKTWPPTEVVYFCKAPYLHDDPYDALMQKRRSITLSMMCAFHLRNVRCSVYPKDSFSAEKMTAISEAYNNQPGSNVIIQIRKYFSPAPIPKTADEVDALAAKYKPII